MTATTVERIFKLGATSLPDPCPHGSLDDAIRVLCRDYPQFRSTKVYPEDGVMDNGKLIYTVKLPPAKTNG